MNFCPFRPKIFWVYTTRLNEFLIYLLDKIHEDLNTITIKPYIEMESKKPELTDEEVSKIRWDKHLKRDGQFKLLYHVIYVIKLVSNLIIILN